MGTDILTQIVARKKQDVAAAKARVSEADLSARIETVVPPRPFEARMSDTGAGRVNIIAEIKRASPSKGPIRPDLDPAALAKAYTAGGAAAISVLTDTPYFSGSLDDLALARTATDLPILRKDFTIDPYQILEARAWGADAVLVIVRILTPDQVAAFIALAHDLGMGALVEIHTEADLAVARESGAVLVGINNRNLSSFHTDISTAMAMAGMLGPGQTPVAASGIATRADVDANLALGIHDFLIGESLVRADDPSALLRTLRGHEALADRRRP